MSGVGLVALAKKATNSILKVLLWGDGKFAAALLLGYFAYDFAMNAPFEDSLGGVSDEAHEVAGRERQSSPVTIVEIDEKSLKEIGQWPWPRNKTAMLISEIGSYGPAAIALDFYMPEADQTSPDKVADNLPAGNEALAEQLRQLRSHDQILADALYETPSILGAAGFNFETLTTSSGMRVNPINVTGGDAVEHVRNFPFVLASLPELQMAAYSQCVLSVDADADSGLVRHIPLVSAINGDLLVPSMPLEALRVGFGVEAININVNKWGVESYDIGDMNLPVQSDGQMWLHFAEADIRRYLSASDILRGEVDPEMLTNKIVLLSLSGAGLTDYRGTPLGEYVPGIEIQAQVIESLFDGDYVLAPFWMKWAELLLMVLGGLFIIWAVPQMNEAAALGVTLVLDFVFVQAGVWMFHNFSILFDSGTLGDNWILTFTLLEVCMLLSEKYFGEDEPEVPGVAVEGGKA